jgi:hypothetical protein
MSLTTIFAWDVIKVQLQNSASNIGIVIINLKAWNNNVVVNVWWNWPMVVTMNRATFPPMVVEVDTWSNNMVIV